MIIDLKEFIPKKLDHRDVFIREYNNYLEIKCNKIRPPKSIRIRKQIILDKSFFEVIGLYYGDGTNARTGSGNRRVALANNNPILHKYWIKFLENFGIKKEQLYAQIYIRKSSYLTHKEFLAYWRSKTNIPFNRFCSKINIRNFKTKKYGLLVVNFNNKLFREIFDKIFNFSLDLCKKNKEFGISFLRGFFAAEGHITINKFGSLAWLDIPIKDLKRRAFIKYLFNKIGIKLSENKERILVTGYLNFEKCYNYHLTDLHPNKNKDFKRGYNNLISKGSVPALTKLKIIDSLKRNSKTRFQIAKETDLGFSTIYKSLKDLEIKGIVKRVGKTKWKDIWSLVDSPRDLFSLMKRDY